tara:strand:+ start:1095 stop:1403 length:309 start_codon:yes stop_codon:yes gene_type:complete
MTNAPEKIWAVYPTSGERDNYTIYGYNVEPFVPADDDPCSVAEYTRTDVAEARIAELEAYFKLNKQKEDKLEAYFKLNKQKGDAQDLKREAQEQLALKGEET